MRRRHGAVAEASDCERDELLILRVMKYLIFS